MSDGNGTGTVTTVTARVLPPAEWPTKLVGTALETTYETLDPNYSVVIVVEDDQEQVVACTAFITTVMGVGLWEAESVRGQVLVSLALARTIAHELVKHHVKEVLAQAETDEAADRLARLGGRHLPGSLWVLPVTPVGDTT